MSREVEKYLDEEINKLKDTYEAHIMTLNNIKELVVNFQPNKFKELSKVHKEKLPVLDINIYVEDGLLFTCKGTIASEYTPGAKADIYIKQKN